MRVNANQKTPITDTFYAVNVFKLLNKNGCVNGLQHSSVLTYCKVRGTSLGVQLHQYFIGVVILLFGHNASFFEKAELQHT